MLVFKEREKPEYPEKNLFEQRRGATTNSTPTYGIAARSRTRATLVGAACLSHATRFQAHSEKCKIFTSKKKKGF